MGPFVNNFGQKKTKKTSIVTSSFNNVRFPVFFLSSSPMVSSERWPELEPCHETKNSTEFQTFGRLRNVSIQTRSVFETKNSTRLQKETKQNGKNKKNRVRTVTLFRDKFIYEQ